MLIQKLRLKQGWSQQQLAEASGLSIRTIQRIEAGHPASVETLKSIAAVFEVDFASLSPTPPESPTMSVSPTARTAEQQEAEAFKQVRTLRRFYLHLFKYLAVTLVLLAVHLLTTPPKMWVFWVIGGWGLGVVLHAVRVFSPRTWLGAQWERQQVEKRLGRPL